MELLSGGQKPRVAFGLLSLQLPHIFILDEPPSHLDVEAMVPFSTALSGFEGGVLVVPHDITVLKTVCKHLWVC